MRIAHAAQTRVNETRSAALKDSPGLEGVALILTRGLEVEADVL
jgi:hypothetical protein